MPLEKLDLEILKPIDFTKTSLTDIKQEVIDYIKNHPTYNLLWDNFYDSDSGKMILDTFSFVMRKLMVRTDILANEAYPATAQQDSSVIKILKLIGYELRSYTQGIALINVDFPQGRPAAEVLLGIEYALQTTDTQGNSINFYVRRDGPYDYFNPVKIDLDIDGKAKEGLILRAYSGELKVDIVDRSNVNTKDGEVYTLNNSPVTQDSVRVFYYDTSGTKQEAVRVDSFFNVPSEETYVPFIVHFDEFRGAYVEFGDSDLVKVLPDFKDIEMYYCIGGGESHNIVENSINISDSFNLPTLVGSPNITVSFNNPGRGFGGKDPESIEEAKRTAPLSLKTINRAVTEEDYVILLRQQGLVRYAQALSPNDNREYFPAESEIPLFHVWLYITINRPVTNMTDLLITKQVNEVGKLIGGDAYDILTFLNERRIVGIENVIKPTIYTRLYFKIQIEYNRYINVTQIEKDARDLLEEMHKIENSMYWKLVRLNDIVSRLKSEIVGVLDVKILNFWTQSYDQILDVVSSPYYFRYVNEEPEKTEQKEDITELTIPKNYLPVFYEVPFLLDKENDIEFVFEVITAS
jgi:hypothetical protein